MEIINFITALIFLFLTFSLFTSWILAFITQRLNLKGKFLEKKLSEALNSHSTDWLKLVFKNPLLKSILRKDRAPSEVDPALFAQAVVNTVNADQEKTAENEGLPNLINALGSDLTPEETKKAVEDWFNTFNKRITYWYKDQTRKYLIVIGFVVACVFNVDMVEIGQTLWTDQKLSASIAFTAEEFVKNHDADDAKAQAAAKEILFDFQQSKLLPIGWHPTDQGCFCIPKDINIMSKLFGFILSAFVVTLGAPFWFDALKKVLSLKSSKK